MAPIENTIRIGAEVELTNPNIIYTLGESNPVKGGKDECIGDIVNVHPYIRVNWRNGKTNVYKKEELSLVRNTSTYRSIW